MMTDIIFRVTKRIEQQFENDSSGHDFYHIQRVLKMSEYLQSKEGGDLEIIQLSALLHDISDHKMNGGKLNAGGEIAYHLLLELDYPEKRAVMVKDIVDGVSFKGANVPDKMNLLEGKIVQDADRLDALGAIGIARTFAFGGSRNRPIYVPDVKPETHDSFESYANSKSHTVNHFYEKLLHLKERLHTPTALKIGEERHLFMEEFLHRFYHEWDVLI